MATSCREIQQRCDEGNIFLEWKTKNKFIGDEEIVSDRMDDLINVIVKHESTKLSNAAMSSSRKIWCVMSCREWDGTAINNKAIHAGIIWDLDAITSIESAKSDITCNDTYIVSCLNFAARHNNFIDNNVNLPYFTTRVWQQEVLSHILYTWNAKTFVWMYVPDTGHYDWTS